MGRFLGWVAFAGTVGLLALALTGINAPSPPLFAGLLGALGFALAYPNRITMPRPVFVVAQAAIGVTVAAQVDTGALRAFSADWPAIVLVSLATLIVSALAGQLLLLHGVSRSTATFASIAGGASGMTAIADDLGADSRVVTVIQYLRVLVILLSLPAFVSIVFAPDRTAITDLASNPAQASDYVFVILAITVGHRRSAGWLASRRRPCWARCSRDRPGAHSGVRRCSGADVDPGGRVLADRYAGRAAIHQEEPRRDRPDGSDGVGDDRCRHRLLCRPRRIAVHDDRRIAVGQLSRHHARRPASGSGNLHRNVRQRHLCHRRSSCCG